MAKIILALEVVLGPQKLVSPYDFPAAFAQRIAILITAVIEFARAAVSLVTCGYSNMHLTCDSSDC